MGNCKGCNVELVVGNNWYPSYEKNHIFICNLCVNKKLEIKRREKGILPKVPWDGNCRVCGVKLIVGINWREHQTKDYDHICRECDNKRQMKWKNKEGNREKVNKNSMESYHRNKTDESIKKKRDFQRDNYIRTYNNKGESILLKVNNKRHYPKDCKCEICKNEYPFGMGYHHWDDEKPEYGLWICAACHCTANIIEKIPNFIEMYVSLKKKVEEGEI